MAGHQPVRSSGEPAIGEQGNRIAEPGADEVFVWSVAVSGPTAIVGASYHDIASDTNQWAAYVFARAGSAWTRQAKLTGGEANDGFGFSVAVSGTAALIGAPFRGLGWSGYQGAADVFVQNGSAWTRQAVLTASDGAVGEFGYSVAISGTTALVGAPVHDVGSNPSQGVAYAFSQNGPVWTQQAQLTASNGAAGDLFGNSVAISGGTAVVGAPYRQFGPAQPGAAYVFVQNGAAWTQQTQLAATFAGPADRFGYSVAVSGARAIVGAFVHDVGSNSQQGAAYLFVQNQDGAPWTQASELTSADGAGGDGFGYSVALSGMTALVGAPGRQVGSNASQGAAYLYSTPVSIAAVGGNTQSTPVGQPFLMPLQAKVADADGLGVPDVAVAFTPPASGASASLSNAGQAVTGSDGIAALSATANLTVGGPYTVSASIDSGAIVASPRFSLTNIVGRASADITVSGGGIQSATVGKPFATALQVNVTDALGNPAPGVIVTFSAPSSGASASFPDNGQVATDSNGIARIVPTANTKSGGPYAVTASIIGGAVVSSPGFSLINNAGPPVVMLQRSGAPNLAVTLLDQYANPAPKQPVTFTIVPGPTGSSGTLGSASAQLILSGPDGSAAAPVLVMNRIPGLFTVIAQGPPPLPDAIFLLTVKADTAPYLVSYAANLNAGDSFVNVANYGTLDGNDPAGAICVNVYVYDPNEEPVSCCSCPVTPNGLKTLSVRDDLISKPVSEGSAPNSVVVKLLATAPVNGTCNAGLTTSNDNGPLARGMGAWMTTLHALTSTTPPTWQPTQPEFAPSELSDSELFKLRAVCGFIQTNASGFGLCRCK